MNPLPTLTVITPTYNRGDYLAETIESVFSQDFHDIEYIIIDDGSKDETPAVVDRYLRRGLGRVPNLNLRYIRHDNIGETRTINRGLSMVRGEFFAIVNSDDPLKAECLKKVIGALKARPDALAAYPDWEVIDAQSVPVNTIRLVDYDIDKLFTHGFVAIGPGACFRTTAIELVGYRDPLLKYTADLDYWYRMALLGPLVHVPEVLATHRVHPASASISDKGTRLADETAYLFSGHVRHPLHGWRRRYRALADAHGEFAAIFACSNLRDAKRRLVRSILAQPIFAIKRCEAHSVGSLSNFLTGLGATRNGLAERFFPKVLEAQNRAACIVPAARGILSDPIGMIALAQHQGIAALIYLIRSLPRASSPSKMPLQPRAPLEARPATLDNATIEQLAAAFAARIRDVPGNQFHKPFDEAGYHLLRRHYYVPIPELADIRPEDWTSVSDMAGVDMNERAAHELMDVMLPPYLAEFRARFPIQRDPDQTGFYLINGTYMAVDAHVLYGLVRHVKPRRIIEIGNGASTMVAVAAGETNRAEGHPVEVISIDPYPSLTFANGYPGLNTLITKKVQEVPIKLFESLDHNDILFIDSSHVLRAGNDVQHIYLNVLPILKNGIYVHVHDISLPLPYPKAYFDSQLYWNEQYLLQAFLIFNSRYKVIWPGNYMMLKHPAKMMAVFPEIADMRAVWMSSEPTAFWMRTETRGQTLANGFTVFHKALRSAAWSRIVSAKKALTQSAENKGPDPIFAK